MHVCVYVYVTDLSDLVNLWTVYLLIIHFYRIKLLTNIKIYPDKCDCEPYFVTPKILFHRKRKNNNEPIEFRNILFVFVRVYFVRYHSLKTIDCDALTKNFERTTQDVYVIIVMNWLWYEFLYRSQC